jgi:transposase InsO family protein
LDNIREATSQDVTLQTVARYTNEGWPVELTHIPYALHKFHAARAHLSEVQGLLLHDDRIVVPSSQQKNVLSQIHQGHQGLTKFRQRANMTVWWPGIGRDVTEMVKTCEFCLRNKPTQRKEPLMTAPLPHGPWQKIAADICEQAGKQYLVVVDYYLRDIEIAHLPTMSSQQVISRLKSMFVRWGIPLELVSDNGTHFTLAEFRQFSETYDFGCNIQPPLSKG